MAGFLTAASVVVPSISLLKHTFFKLQIIFHLFFFLCCYYCFLWNYVWREVDYIKSEFYIRIVKSIYQQRGGFGSDSIENRGYRACFGLQGLTSILLVYRFYFK